MTSSAPEPDDLAGPGLPRDPHDYAVRRRGLGLTFWALMALCLLCIAAGVVIDRYGPKLFPPKAAPPAPYTHVADAFPPVDLTAAASAAPPAQPASGDGAAQPPAALASLAARLDGLEAENDRLRQASAEALAAADLSQAAQSSRPFAGEVDALRRLLPDSADLSALAAYAAAGAPSRAALAMQLDDQADRVAVAARTPPKDSGVLANVAHMLAAVFTIRRVDRTIGSDPDAILARAQRMADDGDLEGAVQEIDALSPEGRAAASDWRAQAERRIAIDRLTAAIRANAAHDLGALTPSSA